MSISHFHPYRFKLVCLFHIAKVLDPKNNFRPTRKTKEAANKKTQKDCGLSKSSA